ncbi:MAG: TolC family protein [Lentisphaeria bacterium]|nr:TolC family protein [Lentisphaeria bacterium]
MKKHSLFFAVILSFTCGCFQYTPPTPVLLSNKFTPANHSASDEILLSLSVLTLNDARKIALQNNQNYRAAYLMVDAARMRYYQSMGAYAPEISVGNRTGQNLDWGYNMHNPPSDIAGRNYGFSVSSTVNASYLLFDGFARYLNVLIQKSSLAKETAIRNRVRCMLKRSVEYAYFDMQLAAALQSIQRENIEFNRRMYNLTSPEVLSGKRNANQALNFQIIIGDAQGALLDAVNQQQIANYALAQLMGYSAGELPKQLALEPLPEKLERIYYSVDACIEIALENNPDMHIMQQQLKIAYYNKLKSYSAFFPVISANFQYKNINHNSSYQNYRVNSSHYGNNEMYYGVEANYLIFNGFTRYNTMREMQAMLAVTEFNMAETYLQILNDIRSAYANYDTAYKRYQIYQSLIPLARQERELVRDLYLKYQEGVDRLDRTQNDFVSAQTNTVVAITNCRKAIAQLEAIMMMDIYPNSGSRKS